MQMENVQNLNNTCMQLNAFGQSTLGFKQTESNSAETITLSKSDSDKILGVLKAIPIYEEVLPFKGEGSQHFSERDHSAYHAYSQNNGYNMVCGTKRVASSSFETDMYSPVVSGSVSTAQSFSQNNSHAENSHPIGSYRSGLAGGSTGINAKQISSLDQNMPTQTGGFEGAYAQNQLYGSYGQVFTNEGAQTILPPGYVQVQRGKPSNRKTKVVTKCEHKNRKHYAKGLCSTCYHKGGRTKKAWKCEHKNKLHYAKGCCQECYITFHSKRGLNKLKRMVNENSNSLTELLGEDEYSPYADEF